MVLSPNNPKNLLRMSKRHLFPVACILAAMVFTVSCNRKAVFGKSPVSKLIDAMTLQDKVNLLVYTQGSGQTYPISRLGIPSVEVSACAAGKEYNVNSLAQSWNLQLVRESGVSTGARMRSGGTDLLLIEEPDIENPVIKGRMTAALVEGVQSNGLGAALSVNTIDDKGFEVTLRESQPRAVIVSCAAPDLIAATDSILRSEWGFEGVIMMGCPGDSAVNYVQSIAEAVQNGLLDAAVIDYNVERMLDLIAGSPRMQSDDQRNVPVQEPDADMLRSGIAEGMVLLKNNGILPLGRNFNMIALYGVNSYDMYAQALKDAGFKLEPSVYTAYSKYSKEPVVPSTLVRKPYQFRADAIASHLAIITLGRADANDYLLTDAEKELIKDVCDAFHSKNKKVVVLLNTDSPIGTASWKSQPDAILLAGKPGQLTGSAVTDILNGRVNTSGKLIETYLDDNISGNSRQISYPFGYGLSYTSFIYSEPQVEFQAGTVNLSVTVTNTGVVPGKDIVQLYLERPGSRLANQTRELRSYAKTSMLQPGESQILEFVLPEYDLNVQGEYKADFSASSQDTRCKTSFSISLE